MPRQERLLERARRLARRDLLALGEDIREIRLRSGMSLQELSAATRVSISELSRIERGLSPHVQIERMAMIGAVVRLDVRVRGFPSGPPIRDAAQLLLTRRLRELLPAQMRLRTEVPLRIPGDLRAWDGVIDSGPTHRPVELESRLRDLQALLRRIHLKCRDSNETVVLLVVADTRHNRHVLKVSADELADQFPVGSRDALTMIRGGTLPERGAILLL
jgi:transcriptional regulator with XRE-family HTH domain